MVLFLLKGPELLGIKSSFKAKKWNSKNGKHYCMLFNILVLMQIFGAVFASLFRGSTRDMLAVLKKRKNKLVIGGVVMAEVMLVMWGGPLVRAVPLSVSKHLLCIMLSIIPFVVAQPFLKMVDRVI